MRHFTAGAVTAAALALAPHAAFATGVAPVTGYGQFTPGLIAVPTIYYIEMTVQGTLVGVPAGPFTCDYDVQQFGNTGGGVGTAGDLDCSGAVTASSTTCSSQRTGMTVEITCPTATGSVDGSFHLSPTFIGPVLEYFTVVGTVTAV